MAGTISSAQHSAAVSAYFNSVARLTEHIPGGRMRQGAAGSWIRFTNLPIGDQNFVDVGADPDLGEVDAFAKELSATGLPWTLQVRGEVGPELAELADRYGKTVAQSMPLLLWDADSLPHAPAAMPPGARVRTLSGAEYKAYAAALAAGFGVPEEFLAIVFGPDLLDAPGVTAFLLDLDGESVASGLNLIVGDHVGMYAGSVPPSHRGNGYYRALVTARLTDAVAHGARHAFSRNTPMSRPLFEAVGFRVAQEWTCLSSAAGEAARRPSDTTALAGTTCCTSGAAPAGSPRPVPASQRNCKKNEPAVP